MDNLTPEQQAKFDAAQPEWVKSGLKLADPKFTKSTFKPKPVERRIPKSDRVQWALNHVPDSAAIPPCCLYPADDLISDFYTSSDLPVTLMDVSTSSTLTLSGTTYTGGGVTVSLGSSQWERNGIEYGDCLVKSGVIEDQFDNTYSCSIASGTVFTLTRQSTCIYAGINPDNGATVNLIYMSAYNVANSIPAWATTEDQDAWVACFGTTDLAYPPYNTPDFQSPRDTNQSSPAGTYGGAGNFNVF